MDRKKYDKKHNYNKIDVFTLNDMDKYVNFLIKPIGQAIHTFIKRNVSDDQIIEQKDKLVEHPELMNLRLVEIFYELYKISNESLISLPNFHTNNINLIIDYYIKKVIINYEAFYLINLSDIERRCNDWKLYFPKIIPHYAIKSNPDKRIVSLLQSFGINFDCASMEEIKIALKCGAEPSQIIYANPVKSIEYLLFAKDHGIDLMTFDSIEELHKIKKYYSKARILLRIKTNDMYSASKLSFKFGMEKHEIELALQECKKLNLNLVGVSFHVGSKATDINAFTTAFNDARYVFDLAYNLGIKLSILDIGGGFTYQTVKEFYKVINQTIDTLFITNEKYKDIQIISEPGRFFVETSHTLVLNIIGKKSASESDTHIVKYYLNDGIYGSLNNIERDSYVITILPVTNKKTPNVPSIFFGPTCDSYDTIANNVLFPLSDINEWVYIKNMGAYTRAGACEFNGFPNSICYYYMDNIS
jgi:ornithine decarboxylase